METNNAKEYVDVETQPINIEEISANIRRVEV